MILDMRTAETNFYKVASRLEEVGAQAVEEKFAHICDVIGNALADEAAELAAKLLRPTTSVCKQAEVEDTEAFLICIRLG